MDQGGFCTFCRFCRFCIWLLRIKNREPSSWFLLGMVFFWMQRFEKWETGSKGIRTKKHPTRKHGIKSDIYFVTQFQFNGKRKSSGLSWANEGWTLDKAKIRLSELKEDAKAGQGLRSHKEKQIEVDEKRKEAEQQEQASQQMYEMALLSLHCGLRAGEIFSLTWKDIDLNHGLITLLNTKSGRTRTLSMTGDVKAIFPRIVTKKQLQLWSSYSRRKTTLKKLQEIML